MSHWVGQSDRYAKHMEEMQSERNEVMYELSLSKWFKIRRSFKRFMLMTVLYQSGVLTIGIGVYYYYNGNTESMILFTIGNALIALNWLFNNKES